MTNQIDTKIIDSFVSPDFSIAYDLDFTSFVNQESFIDNDLFNSVCNNELRKILDKHLKQAIVLAMHEFSYQLHIKK